MTRLVGLERDENGLREALSVIAGIERAGAHEPALLHMTAAAKPTAAAALARHARRGAHFRTDFPETIDPPQRSFLTLADAQRIAESRIQEHEHRNVI